MIRPVGVGFMSCSPTGVVGLTDYPHPAPAGLQRHLLGHELRALVMADHVCESHWRIFVGRMAVAGESDGGDAGCVYDAADSGFARGFENCAGAFDVRAVHFGGIADPEPVVGGDVKDGLAACHGFFQGCGVAEIAGGGFGF